MAKSASGLSLGNGSCLEPLLARAVAGHTALAGALVGREPWQSCVAALSTLSA